MSNLLRVLTEPQIEHSTSSTVHTVTLISLVYTTTAIQHASGRSLKKLLE